MSVTAKPADNSERAGVGRLGPVGKSCRGASRTSGASLRVVPDYSPGLRRRLRRAGRQPHEWHAKRNQAIWDARAAGGSYRAIAADVATSVTWPCSTSSKEDWPTQDRPPHPIARTHDLPGLE